MLLLLFVGILELWILNANSWNNFNFNNLYLQLSALQYLWFFFIFIKHTVREILHKYETKPRTAPLHEHLHMFQVVCNSLFALCCAKRKIETNSLNIYLVMAWLVVVVVVISTGTRFIFCCFELIRKIKYVLFACSWMFVVI